MRVLVTGGAGFIGSHFVKRLAAAGHDVVVLDKLTYSGNKANLDGVDVELVVGDICDADAVARAGAGCEAVVNFAAETHVDRSILGAAEFIETDVHGTYVLLGWARDAGVRLVQVSTDEVYGDIAEGERSVETDPLRPSSPYSASKAGGDLQVLAAVRTFGIDACITRGANTFGPNQYPEKLIPLFVTNASRRASRCPSTATAGSGASGCTSRTTAPRSSSSSTRAGRARSTTSAARSTRTWRSPERILELTGAAEDLVRHVEDRAGHDRRYALDDSKLRRLGWVPAALARRDRPGRDGRVVPRQPPLVGADQERRVPAVLRRAVRRPPPLNPCKRREGQLA